MDKIGIYGGSFDPPHKGHMLLAENLRESCAAEKVIIIPTAMSPFKSSSGASAADRLHMCRLAFSGDIYEVSDIEISRGGKSYTVDTMRAIREENPDAHLYLFMGEDMLLSFDRWYEYKEISRMCTIVAACRTENREKLQLMKDFAKNILGDKDGDKVIISESVPVEISSTEIRRSLFEGECPYVSSDVYEYIKSRGLYRE